jgi:hypothetical protein
VRFAVAVLCLFLGSAAHAFSCCSNFGQGRIGAGADVVHEAGTPVASFSLYPVSLYAWSGNYGAVLAYPVGRPTGLNAEFGGILVRYVDETVGTNGNFFTRVSWCGQKLCVSFAHVSHGARVFGIREELANKGFNFLFLEYKYR